MSSSIGKIMGAGGASTKKYSSEKDILNYLKNYDTSNVDNTLNNMTNSAYNMSNNLNNMGDYTFSVDGSDDARKRAEDATYNSYMDRLNPRFEQQSNDMQSRLVNQGLTPGSEAYQRAFSDLQEKQNDATNQAAYQSTLAGQNAYTQSLQDQINASGFGNMSQQSYANLLNSLIANSPSGYDKNMDIFGIQSGYENRKSQNQAANSAAQVNAGNNLLFGGANAVGSFFGK